jgi:hypothetical protein
MPSQRLNVITLRILGVTTLGNVPTIQRPCYQILWRVSYVIYLVQPHDNLTLVVIHQSWRRRVNFDSSKHSNLCGVIMDSRWHYSSRRSCPPDWSGEHCVPCSSLLCGFAAVVTFAYFSNFQVSSVNIYYLLANETVDDIIWYMPWTLFSLHKCCISAHALNCDFHLLLRRDVVQGKLENLGQVRFF